MGLIVESSLPTLKFTFTLTYYYSSKNKHNLLVNLNLWRLQKMFLLIEINAKRSSDIF